METENKLALPKNEITTNTLYDLNLDDDLFATAEKIAELKEEGQLDQVLEIDLGQQDGFDNSWRYHRTVSIGKTELINWSVPLTKEEKKERTGQELNPNKAAHQFVAVRGIPIMFQYGAQLSISDGSNTKTVCRTKALVEHMATGDRTTKGTQPLKTPISRMHFSNKEYTRPFYFFEKNKHVELIAERYDQESETWVERKCLDCISQGEHFIGDIAKSESPRCRPNGSLLFCVYELGVKDTDAHEEDDINNPITIKWVSVDEANIRQEDGTPLNRPFILRLRGLGASQLAKIGTGKYDIPVVLPSHMKPNQAKTCYLPDDNVMSTQEFYDWLTDKKGFGIRHRVTGNGNLVFTAMTELYSGQLTETRYNSNYCPVFRPVKLEEGNTWNGIRIEEYVKGAIAIMQHEAAASQGSTNNLELTPSTTEQKAIASSEVKEDNGTVTPSKSTSKTSDKAKQAFKVDTKTTAPKTEELNIEELPY